MKPCLIFAALLASTLCSGQEEITPDVILCNGQPTLLKPPVLLTTASVVDAKLTSDGQYALVNTSTPLDDIDTLTKISLADHAARAKQSLLLWKRKSFSTTVVFQFQPQRGEITDFFWLQTSHFAVIELSRVVPDESTKLERQSLVMLNADSGKLTELYSIDNQGDVSSGYVNTYNDPDRPVAILDIRTWRPNAGHQLLIVNNGTAKVANVNSDITDFFGILYLDASNDIIFRGKNKAGVRSAFVLDLSKANLNPIIGEIPPLNRNLYSSSYQGSDSGLTLTKSTLEVGDKTWRKRVESYYVSANSDGKKSTALVCADGRDAQLNRKEDIVLYTINEGTFVREFVPITKRAYDEIIDSKERLKLMNSARDVAYAFCRYSDSHNDTFPGHESWQSFISSYVKDESSVDRFNYTFGGGSIASVQSPAETELGYINGPSGRAVAYIDGHVKWEPKK